MPDRPLLYLVLVDHPKGPYIPETDLDRASLIRLCKDLREKQYENVFAILECNVRDATHEFKDLLPQD